MSDPNAAPDPAQRGARTPEPGAHVWGPRRIVCLTEETTEWLYLLGEEARIVGISLSVKVGEAAYIPLAHSYAGVPEQLDAAEVLVALRPWLEDERHAKLGQNIKYDSHVFTNAGIAVRGYVHDTLLQSYVLEAHKPHSLESLALRHLGRSGLSYEDVCGKGAHQIPFAQVDIARATEYSGEDSDMTLHVHEVLWPQLREQAGPGILAELSLLPVAAVAAHLGMKCRLVQEKWVPWEDPVNDKVGNILLSRMMGADSRLDPAGFDIGIRDSWKDALREVEESGGTPYAIPAGASEHKFGGLGFANWAFEVAEQEKALGVFFDTIVVCTVTGSTHAGMIAGFAALEELTGVKRRVLGIDASATLEKTRDQVARIARHTAELIEVGRDIRDDEIQVLEGWAGDLYGIPVESTMNAIAMGAQLEAMITDPVYEGKSLAGLIDLVKDKDIPADSNVLYAHLGGQQAVNAYHRLWDPSA